MIDSRPETQAQLELLNVTPTLEVRSLNGVTDVVVSGKTISSFRADDAPSRNLAIVALAEGETFDAKEIADAFGVHASRVSQLRVRYRSGGAAALIAKTKAARERALTKDQLARVRAWYLADEDLDIDDLHARAKRHGYGASRSAVGRAVKGLDAKRRAAKLPLEGPPAERPSVPVISAEAPAAVSVESAEAIAVEPIVKDTVASPVAAPERSAALEAAPTLEAPAAVEAARAEPVSEATVVEPQAVTTPPAATDEAAAEEPAVEISSRVAGAMVAHAALEAIGLQSALAASGARLKPATVFDLVRVAAVVFFGALLRFRTIESLRFLVRRDFGALLGIGAAPEVRTMRRKLKELASPEAGFDPGAFVAALARGLLGSAPAPDGVYFFDDHFKEYHGAQPLAKGWDAKRRIGAPGIEDVYVHDLLGRAILFVPLAAPTSLSRAIPLALGALQRAGAPEPSLAVFDRGGFARALFRSLVAPSEPGRARIDFLTYLKARGKQSELPIEAFRKVTLTIGRRSQEFEIAESTLAMRGFERPLRLIVLLDRRKGKQIPIVTSDEKTAPERLVYLLRARWRQENSFKYLVGELGIDALVSRDMVLAKDLRTIDNPDRIAQRAQIAEVEEELAAIDARIAAALASNEEARRPTVRGFKIAHAALTQEREVTLGILDAMREDLRTMPATVQRCDLDPDAKIATPRPARRVFVTALKLAAHNAERWLAAKLGAGPYEGHALAILRALFDQAGTIRVEPHRVCVRVQPLDTPRYQRCVERLFADLNARGCRLLGSDRVIEFSVAGARSEG